VSDPDIKGYFPAVYENDELKLSLYRESTGFYTTKEICTLSRNDYRIKRFIIYLYMFWIISVRWIVERLIEVERIRKFPWALTERAGIANKPAAPGVLVNLDLRSTRV